MAEIERLQMADATSKSFTMVKEKIDTIVSHELAPVVKAVDNWAIDGFVAENGMFSGYAQKKSQPFAES